MEDSNVRSDENVDGRYIKLKDDKKWRKWRKK